MRRKVNLYIEVLKILKFSNGRILLSIILLSLSTASLGIYELFIEGFFPPSWSGDSYGHLFKIWKLYNYGWTPWIRDWYSGYPFLRFYPPLSYLIATVIAKIVRDIVLG